MPEPEPASEPAWKPIAARKQAERLTAIPRSWRLETLPGPERTNVLDVPLESGILTSEELFLTETYDATDLVRLLASGEVESQRVVGAFCKRAAVAQQVTNCLTEIFFDKAMERARYLDAYFAKHNRPIGPLHGLPISLKDSFRVRGTDASIGLATFCFSPSESNSTLVDLLLAAGAVLYCKTNVPQTLGALDSHNNVFGRTLNPANTLLTAGGSSGGEAALIAMRGSPLGVGTDIGGSIRIPALCHGLYGLKPSHGRVPYGNQESGTVEGAENLGVRASAGPIARSLRDVEMFMRVVGEMEAWKGDAEVIAQGWDGQLPLERRLGGKTKLRVGVVRCDGVTIPMPPVAKFMDETAAALRETEGVEVVELDITSLLSKCQSLINKLLSIDGGNHMFDLIESTGEDLSPWLKGRLKRGTRATPDKIIDLHKQRGRMQAAFLDIWREHGGYWQDDVAGVGELDVLICPVAPHTAPPIDAWNTASYTSSFVLLDFPAATLPIRKVRKNDLRGEIEGAVLGSWDKANRRMWKETDKKVWLGGWHCLQVVGRRREERVVVEAMAVLEEALKGLADSKEQSHRAKL